MCFFLCPPSPNLGEISPPPPLRISSVHAHQHVQQIGQSIHYTNILEYSHSCARRNMSRLARDGHMGIVASVDKRYVSCYLLFGRRVMTNRGHRMNVSLTTCFFIYLSVCLLICFFFIRCVMVVHYFIHGGHPSFLRNCPHP